MDVHFQALHNKMDDDDPDANLSFPLQSAENHRKKCHRFYMVMLASTQ